MNIFLLKNKNIKNWFFIIFTLYINYISANPYILNKTIAIVNNKIIFQNEITDMLNDFIQKTTKNNLKKINTTTLYNQMLERIIIDRIITQISNETNISIDNKQLEKIIKNIASDNHVTVEQLCDNFANISIDCNNYREQIRKNMLISKICNNIIGHNITILPEEINSIMQHTIFKKNDNKKFNISHILIPLSNNATIKEIKKKKK